MKIEPDIDMASWHARWVLALGWSDGPTVGVCQLAHDADAVWFSLLDERAREDDLNDRIFALARLPAGSGAAVMRALAFLGPPALPVWSPPWTPDGSDRWRRAEQTVDRIEAARSRVFAIVRSDDMSSVRAGWRVDGFEEVEDWFVRLMPSDGA